MDDVQLAAALTDIRVELTRYVIRLTGDPSAADDIVQTTYIRAHEAMDHAPQAPDQTRRWLFRIATNLALDELRRRSRIRRRGVIELREAAESNPAFLRWSAGMVGTPEVAHVVREHIDVCFGCVVRNLRPHRAAALLLRDMYGFSVNETADMVNARPAQVKNWIQDARRTMQERYAETCALVAKTGVCHQCSELSTFFRVPGPRAIGITAGSVDERLKVTRPLNSVLTDEWHLRLLRLPLTSKTSRRRAVEPPIPDRLHSKRTRS